MAEKLAVFERLLDCPICQKTFADPVSLNCKHSFCSECLQNFWENSESKSCPLCKRRSSMSLPFANFALKQLADSFADMQTGASEKSGSSKAAEDVDAELMCSLHKEKKMFCENEQEVLCAVCDFHLHRGHKVVPVEEAVGGLKKELQSYLKPLKDKKEKCKEFEEGCEHESQNFQKQMLRKQIKIKEKYEILHQRLKAEEMYSLEMLRIDMESKRRTMIRKLEKVKEQMSSLSGSISAVEEEQQKDTVAFLNSYRSIRSRARDQCLQSDPTLYPGRLFAVEEDLYRLSPSMLQEARNIYIDPTSFEPYAGTQLPYTPPTGRVQYQQFADFLEKYRPVPIRQGYGSVEMPRSKVKVEDLPVQKMGSAKESVEEKYVRSED